MKKLWSGNFYQRFRKIFQVSQAKKQPVSSTQEMGSLSKLNVLFINLPPWLPFAPPLGLASVATTLKQLRFVIDINDLNAKLHKTHTELRWMWLMENQSIWLGGEFKNKVLPRLELDLESEIVKIIDINPDYIGLNVAAPRQQVAAWVVGKLRECSYEGKIVIGGPATFIFQERNTIARLMGEAVDAIVVGEGEEAFVELLDAWQGNGEPKHIRGVSLYNQNGWQKHIERSFIDSLDKLPMPDYSLFDLELYSDRALPLEWGRGCVRKCKFCEVTSMWGKRRTKSPPRIIEEMAFLADKNKINNFVLFDPAANAQPDHFEAVLDLLISKKASYTWSANIIAHPKFDLKLAKKMKAAGCQRAEVGIESGSDKVLKLMRKGARVAVNIRTLHAIKRAGIESVVFLIVGFPGEEEKEFQETLNFLDKNRNYIDLVRSANALVLQSGADIIEELKKTGYVPDLAVPLWHHLWTAPGGNTLEVRQDRVRRLIAHLDLLGIPHELTSGLDEF